MIKVHGHSDDLICIDGDINEEFDIGDDSINCKHLIFSDGTIVKCRYSPDDYCGKWQLQVVEIGKGSTVKHTSAKDEDRNYSDMIEINSDIVNVECWTGKEPTKDELIDYFENHGIELSSLSKEKLYELYKETRL